MCILITESLHVFGSTTFPHGSLLLSPIRTVPSGQVRLLLAVHIKRTFPPLHLLLPKKPLVPSSVTLPVLYSSNKILIYILRLLFIPRLIPSAINE